MTAESNGRESRAMLTVGFSNVPDEKVVEVKKAIEQMVEGLPDAIVELRIGSGRPTVSPSKMPL